MTIYLSELNDDLTWFPSPFDALDDPNGLLAIGGDLDPQRLVQAYQKGIFPWYGPNEPLLWWSPAPRAVFKPNEYQPAKSLKKFHRKHGYQVTINKATDRVIDLCSSTRSADETWLHPEMKHAYKALAEQGICHSVEVWSNQQLVGGLYGINVGQVFCGESMFSLADNASKIGFWHFCHHFQQHHGQLIDAQVMNPHLASLGAIELPRADFLDSLLSLKQAYLLSGCFEPQELRTP